MEKLKQDRLKKLLSSPDFELLRRCIQAEIAALQCEAVNVAPWNEKTPNGTAKFKGIVEQVSERETLLKVLDGYAAEPYVFFDVILTS